MESTASLLRGAIWRRWKSEGGSYSTNMCQPPTSQLSTQLIHLLSDPQWEFCGKKSQLTLNPSSHLIYYSCHTLGSLNYKGSI